MEHHYLSQTQIREWERNRNGRTVVEGLRKEAVVEEKVRKQAQCQGDIDAYRKYLAN